MSNQIKTVLLLGALTGLILFMGQVIGGTRGVQIALILALAMNFFSYWYSDKIVLRLYRAQEVSPQEAPELHAMVGELAREAQVPMPRVYVVPSETPNAFATGRNPQHAAVAVTSGILKLLSPTELKGVLAHEMGHVKNRDILIQTVAATLGGAITYLAYMAQWAAIFGGRDDEEGGGVLGALAMAILAPIAAMLIQMAISRSREYMADATGARLCHNPQALASALEKLAYGNQRIPMQANPSTAHMFIVNPLTGGGLMSWFSTHPPIEERVARLRAMRRY
ncbi:MAG: zinc metalloprotease HtpX [Deltaproteobacteria bacterium]|nr:zinc metalloprotease HtpX [Deltaproteobacteria bacterium]MBW1951935.1 zinc metalloprotease HtpX [Deltaproteobacteria bacterium]MBW1986318.1 zinc metalloprotease HtpX [Deltaproteobacteria bacterium]MBW2134359.1 zinc metalloprotease HtpX [Deltaproteobacteria bacterium]